MRAETLLNLGVPLLFLLLLVVEASCQERAFEPMPRWRRLGVGFFVLTLAIGAVTPQLLPLGYLNAHSVFSLTSWGLWAVPAGILMTTFFGYWLHRAEHRFGWLWRATHQLHHSPVRVDMLGAFYAHPLEAFLKVTMGTLAATYLLGLTGLASAAVGVGSAALAMFQHCNIRTPRGLGYFIQRPESHCLHHERGVHARNFGDLPLWDMMFGTFHNPGRFHGKVGFDTGSSARVADMLLMKDVNTRPTRVGTSACWSCCA